MNQTTPSPNEQTDKTTESSCAEDKTASTLSPNSLRLIVIMIRRALASAIKLCDELVEQLKTK